MAVDSKLFWPHLLLAELLVVAPLASINGWFGGLAFLVVLGLVEGSYGMFEDWFFGID